MNPLIVRSRVDADGVLRVAVPIGAAEADHEMQVTIEPLPQRNEEQAEYLAWLENAAGRWKGDFERPSQGEFEERDFL
ncbi:MAG: hypothetical protein ACLQNE_29935 [Thermoguttaceae bacterium]